MKKTYTRSKVVVITTLTYFEEKQKNWIQNIVDQYYQLQENWDRNLNAEQKDTYNRAIIAHRQ